MYFNSDFDRKMVGKIIYTVKTSIISMTVTIEAILQLEVLNYISKDPKVDLK
jgi:hypothetical protein